MPRLGKWIAKAALQSEHGRTKLTQAQQPTHTTWWSHAEVDRAVLFAIVLEEA